MNITEALNLDELTTEQEKGCDGMSFLQHITMPLSEILLLCNSSANFFVFLCFDRSFQLILKERVFALKNFYTNPNLEQNENLPLNTHQMHSQECRENGLKRTEIELNETNGCSKVEMTKAVDTSSQNVL